MKARPLKLAEGIYSPCGADEATHVELAMHGHYESRVLPVGGLHWHWDMDTESPTITPSILTRMGDDRGVCHSYITRGKVTYLSDSTHEYAGQTLDLRDVD